MPRIKYEYVDEYPICPHCNKRMQTILRTMKGLLEQMSFFSCPHCRKLLGIGGGWIG